jgi:RecA-family ATPase
VLLINAEDPPEIIKNRLYAYVRPQFEALVEVLASNLHIWTAHGDLGPLCRYDTHGNLEITEDFTRLVKVIEEKKPQLVILDPLARILGVDENKNEAIGFLYSRLEKIARTHGLAWLLVHHPPKWARNARSDVAGRGGSALADNARGVWVVTPPDPEQEGLLGDGLVLRLDLVKLSYGPPRSPALFRFAPGEGVKWRELTNHQNLWAALAQLLEGSDGLTAYEIWRRFRSYDKQEIDDFLRRAVEAGLVEEVPTSRGRRTTRYRLRNFHHALGEKSG